MEEDLSRAVREEFVRLYEEGMIYRGNRIVNWCTDCRTTLSDLEVEYEDVNDADRLAHDPAMRWVVGGSSRGWTSGLHQPDGPVRDRGADPRGEPVRLG